MPEPVETLLQRGLAHQQGGRPDLAHALYRQVLQQEPDNAEAWHLESILALHSGNPSAALKMITHAIEKHENAAAFRITLGAVLRALGRPHDALDAYAAALEKDSSNANAYINRATLLQDMQRHEEALADLSAIVTIAPAEEHSPDRAQLRAQSLFALGRLDEGEATCEDALRRHPDHIGCRLTLAENLETQARLEDALAHARLVLERVPRHLRAATIAAAALRRLGKAAEALETLRWIPVAQLPPDIARSICSQRALAHERLGDNEAALREFTAQNRFADRQASLLPPEAAVKPQRYLDMLTRIRRHLREQAPKWKSLPAPKSWAETSRGQGKSRLASDSEKNSPDGQSLPDGQPWGQHPPVFLIGFPRSGTTLLDQILDSHPRIQVLEERPLLSPLRERLESSPDGYPDALASLTASQRDELRALYHTQLLEAGAHADTLAINKLPLNLIHIALIARIFPEAKLILAIRHPCDAVLSCFMQDFALNDAMANFLTLADSAHLYDEVFSLWNEAQAALSPAAHTIRYEDVIADMRSELSRLLDFLSLPWEDALLDYAAHARKRFIRTPSYAQVTGGLHDRSIGRWRNYAAQFAPHMERLAPHIAAFGYEE